nr:MazG nucleotide pyrophosphohydrolase domain-containing protein [Peptoniphilus stercorisuis]
MEKRKDLRYNCDSLQKEGKVSLIRKLKSYNENALLRASNVIDDVSSIGFIWDEVDGALEKVSEELEEVYEAIKKDISYEISNELGDLIFSSVNLCRYLGFNPEDVLDLTIDKFIRRFEIMSELASKKNMKLEYLDLKDQDDLYNEAKHILEKD